MPEHIMTFDIGTSSLKAALNDRWGKVVAEGGASYPVDQPEPGWAEQDPELIWKHICETSQSVISRSSVTRNEIQAVVFVAPWKNIICLNENGELLRDSIIWMDSRAAKQAEKLNTAADRFIGTGLLRLRCSRFSGWNTQLQGSDHHGDFNTGPDYSGYLVYSGADKN